MHLPVPARPHDLCQSPGIVAVPSCSALSSSLHWPDGLRCRSPAARHASALRIATPLESKLPNRCAPRQTPFSAKSLPAGPARWPLEALHDAARLIDHADRGLFQRHIQSSKVSHGCSFPMLVAVRQPTTLIIPMEQPLLSPSPRPQSPHLTQKSPRQSLSATTASETDSGRSASSALKSHLRVGAGWTAGCCFTGATWPSAEGCRAATA